MILGGHFHHSLSGSLSLLRDVSNMDMKTKAQRGDLPRPGSRSSGAARMSAQGCFRSVKDILILPWEYRFFFFQYWGLNSGPYTC
jgi:hypothetical protein